MRNILNQIIKNMFWIGLFIALLAGIIGIGLGREWIKCKFPVIRDVHLDWILIGLLALGLVISAIDYSKQSKTLSQLIDKQRGRILTQKQREYLRGSLSNLSKTKVFLMGIQGDSEAIRFANTLKDVFVDAGWEVDGVWEDILIGGSGSGIMVRQGPSTTGSLGQSVTEILNQIQITSRLVIKADLKSHDLEIIVGSRP